MNTSSWNPAILLAALIPLVLGLQMTALWVMANAANSDIPFSSQVTAAPSAVSELDLAAAQDQLQRQTMNGNDPSGAASVAAATASVSASPTPKQATPSSLEADLASNVMIPVSLEPGAEPAASLPQGQPAAAVTKADKTSANTSDDSAPVAETNSLQPPQSLRTHPAGHYTLQVERFGSLEQLKVFAAKMSLPGPIAYYVQNTGRTWYVLVAGHYDNQQAALGVAEDLTRAHPQIKPWVRAYSEIQGQLP